MKYNPVGWFEIPVSDLERAKNFYESVLEIKMERNDIPGWETVWFPSDESVKGVSGVLMKGDGYHPGEHGPVMYFTTQDIESALARVVEAGGRIMFPKKDIGEWGYISWLWDSEGNRIALHTRKFPQE